MKIVWVVLLLLASADGIAQQPLLPLSEYEMRSAINALESEIATVEDLEQDRNLSAEMRRHLLTYRVELEEALAAVKATTGTEHPNQLAAIVGGTFSAAFPTVAGLLHGGETTCTGTLIGRRSLLTARHCFEASAEPTHYGVFLQHAGIKRVSRIEFPALESLDLALLCLEQPVTGVAPSNLATDMITIGRLRQIVGFGVTNPTASDSGIKRYGTIKTSECSPASGDHICWVYDPLEKILDERGSNVCSRDSGSPVGFATGFNLELEDGVTSNVLPIGACAATSLASSVAVVHHTDWLNSSITSCGTDSPGDIPDCCGPGAKVMVEDGTVPTEGAHHETWTFSVAEEIRLVRVVVNAMDVPGSDFSIEVIASAPLPSAPGCIDLGRYVSCEYGFDGAPPSNWAATVKNIGGTSVSYQLVVTQFPHAED